MKTNYNNLSPFEACIVVVAILGLALIGIEIFMSLPHSQQVGIKNSFAIFDTHDDFVRIQDNATFAMDSMQEFYRQFDIAFEQTFSFPDQIGKPVQKFVDAVNDYSTTVAYNYQQNLQSQNYNAGQVLGAMLIHDSTDQTSNPTQVIQTEKTSQHFYKEYYYHAPGIVQHLIKQK